MENDATYYATLAQLLPILGVAGAIELRWVVKIIRFENPSPWRFQKTIDVLAGIWLRLLAASIALNFFLTPSALFGVKEGEVSIPGFEMLMIVSISLTVGMLAMAGVLVAIMPKSVTNQMWD